MRPCVLDASLWDENTGGMDSSLRKESQAAKTFRGEEVRREGKAKKKTWARPKQSSEVCGIDAGPCGGTSIEVRLFFSFSLREGLSVYW